MLMNDPLPGNTQRVVAIMAGGSGTRFWPLSRRATPKQYLSLKPAEPSLIQQTAERLSGLGEGVSILVVTAAEQAALAKKHLPDSSVLSEPVARNTAACVGYAAVKVKAEVGDVPILFLPADHLIGNKQALLKCFCRAFDLAEKTESLLTIGIQPSHPETGFGYIKKGSQLYGKRKRYRFAK